ELGDAGEIELNAHGLIDLDLSDTWLLALSPDAAGNFALTAADLEKQPLRNRPLVVLAACNAGRAAPYLHEPWGLPMALIVAGARAVFASSEAIPDANAGAFFDAVLARSAHGESPAVALRDERLAWLHKDAGRWTRYVLLFQ
ncbi:MAG TPA: CHAT domain-containing protein, partial [Polyangia bacterium]|nr:CHAT domain-containing protein [Polyangia bacterium]